MVGLLSGTMAATCQSFIGIRTVVPRFLLQYLPWQVASETRQCQHIIVPHCIMHNNDEDDAHGVQLAVPLITSQHVARLHGLTN